jgi:hypothetical protein
MSSKRVVSIVVTAVVAVAACSGRGPTPSTLSPTAAVTSSATLAPQSTVAPPEATLEATPIATAGGPVPFTSSMYDYSLTLPVGWHVGAAILRWDGASAPGNSDPTADKFISPATVSVFSYAAPFSGDLDQFAEDYTAWTVRDHGDTCPATAPTTSETIEIGGETGVLQSWDCGILINPALTLHDGTAFVFVMRDIAVHAATDPADRAIFEEILESVSFTP